MDATTAQLLTHIPELGQPEISNTDDGIRYNYWTNLDDTGLQVIRTKEEVAKDTVRLILLIVDDLDAAIATLGENNVSAKSVYLGRDTVIVKPEAGISANLQLITKAV